VLVGDWTRRDPVITRFLTARGVAGVPLYLWFAPGAGEAEQLPQVLTLGMLLERANQRP
jgi:thiol:disulfide interchange protein